MSAHAFLLSRRCSMRSFVFVQLFHEVRVIPKLLDLFVEGFSDELRESALGLSHDFHLCCEHGRQPDAYENHRLDLKCLNFFAAARG